MTDDQFLTLCLVIVGGFLGLLYAVNSQTNALARALLDILTQLRKPPKP